MTLIPFDALAAFALLAAVVTLLGLVVCSFAGLPLVAAPAVGGLTMAAFVALSQTGN